MSSSESGASPGVVLDALRVPRSGRVYDLEVTRGRGMPLWEGHPSFEVLTTRVQSVAIST